MKKYTIEIASLLKCLLQCAESFDDVHSVRSSARGSCLECALSLRIYRDYFSEIVLSASMKLRSKCIKYIIENSKSCLLYGRLRQVILHVLGYVRASKLFSYQYCLFLRFLYQSAYFRLTDPSILFTPL